MAGLPAIYLLAGGRQMDKAITRIPQELDMEWVLLITQALELGVSEKEIRVFLHEIKKGSQK